MPRGLNDAPAFVRVDAVDGRAQGAAAARADFDDDELAIVAANEIDLAEPAAVAARDDFEAVPLEMRRGARLPEPAALGAHSAAADQPAGFDRLSRRRVESHGPAAAKLRERQHASHASLRIERQVARKAAHRPR